MSAQVLSAIVVDLRPCTRHAECNHDDVEVELHVTGTVEDDGDGGFIVEVLGVAEANGGKRITPSVELLEDCEAHLCEAARQAELVQTKLRRDANSLPFVPELP